MEKYKFANCGCEFPVVGTLSDDRPSIVFDPNLENINLECSRTWDLIGTGNTCGCFQLESQLGQSLARKLKPRNIEHLSALIAILRPGCISQDTKIMVSKYTRKSGNQYYKYKTIKHLYEHSKKIKTIISYNETTGKLEQNAVKGIYYTGEKDVYKVIFNKYMRKVSTRLRDVFDLKCTEDHKLLTLNGWKELKYLKSGDRFAVVKRTSSRKSTKNIDGQKGFAHRCFKHYEYQCVLCDWDEATLDVNHLEGNRYTDNSIENLCFMCPNHHRMYHEGKISKEQVIKERSQYIIPQYPDIEWVEYVGKEHCGKTSVYDITMDGPHHNFIAGNTIVHNCLEAIRDKKSVTMHYIDRKNGLEEVEYFHPALKPILEKTYGEMIYQEQAMSIARDIAGFTMLEADELRKAIGKKLPELMAKIKIKFLDGIKKQGIVTEEEGVQIFDWIEKSQRYSFNKSHSVSYAMNTYLSAYTKAHFSRAFFTSYLRYAKDKAKPFLEIHALIQNARLMGIDVYGPDIRYLFKNFRLFDKVIRFGFFDVKGIGESAWTKILKQLGAVEKILGKKVDQWTWLEFMIHFATRINTTTVSAFINTGAIAYMGMTRTRMMYEYNLYNKLTSREQEWITNYGLVNKDPSLKLEDILRAMTISATGKNGACASEKRKVIISSLLKTLVNPSYNLTDAPEWLASVEESLLGIPLTCTSLDACDTSAANCSCLEYTQNVNPKVTIIAAKIDGINEIKVKSGKNKGQKMAFLKISDLTSNIDNVVIFSDVWTEAKKIAFVDNNILLHGERSKDGGSLVVRRIWQI